LFAEGSALRELFFDLYGTFWQGAGSTLEQQVKEAARIRNARITDCGY
jgi:hypothetical protein